MVSRKVKDVFCCSRLLLIRHLVQSLMPVLMKQYFDNFGNKACCFEDLKPYFTERTGLDAFTSHIESFQKSTVSFRISPLM